MAHVSGPVRSLPGSVFVPPPDMMCDTEGHEDRPATVRLQGETDSFGAEYLDLCAECFDRIKKEDEDRIAERLCDYCGQWTRTARPTRDPDEGNTGRVYYVCVDCRRRQSESIRRELDSDNL